MPKLGLREATLLEDETGFKIDGDMTLGDTALLEVTATENIHSCD